MKKVFVTVDEYLFNSSEKTIIGKTIYAKNHIGSLLARGSYISSLFNDEKSGKPIIRINKILGAKVESMPDSFISTECFVEVDCIPVYPD